MNRFQADVLHHRGEPKVRERTRAEQWDGQPVSLDDLVGEMGGPLFEMVDTAELRRVADRFRSRLTGRQFSRFVNLMVDCYGTPFARQAGLPVGRPKLRAVG